MIEKVLVVVILVTSGARAQTGSCRADGYEMTCRGKESLHGLKSSRDYSEIDTLNVHEDTIDLTDDLIPRDINFSRLTLLNATDNQITRIGRRGFDKIRNVQFLYLSKNRISHAQVDPFQALSKLEVLEMDDALDGTAAQKGDLLRVLFQSKNSFVHLSKIELNKNALEEVHPKTFCAVQGLKRLELNNNRLSSFKFARNCFKELKGLFLAGNLIERIPSDLWDFLPVISTLDLSNNPLFCDCKTLDLFQQDDVTFINQAQTKCASPPQLDGKSVFEVKKDYCSGTTSRGRTTFWQFTILFVIAVGILYVYKRYRERTGRMSSAPVGYHNLEHEQAVEPEFV
ncbi:unnamed protein product [Caenorhabditis sp. 36 PRJEB53466]|nr:unnamed protein product [Caenorhabditis sp. 36 PRJEB53466]